MVGIRVGLLDKQDASGHLLESIYETNHETVTRYDHERECRHRSPLSRTKATCGQYSIACKQKYRTRTVVLQRADEGEKM